MTKHLMAAAVLTDGCRNETAHRPRIFPIRTVTIIIPFAGPAGRPPISQAGSSLTFFNRHLGQKFVVENVGGAGGDHWSAFAPLARQPDGYTIPVRSLGAPMALGVGVLPKSGLRSQKDFEADWTGPPNIPNLLVVRKNFPRKITSTNSLTMPNPMRAKLNVGHAGLGSVSYIGCLLLNSAIGIKPTMVPFTGNSPRA